MIEIKNRYTNAVIFSLDCDTWKTCVEAAVKAGVDLGGADLCGADLSGANLSGAKLRKADLRGADLRRSDLRGADLCGADLSGANLSWSDLRGADLRRSDLRGAELYGADLRGAELSGSDLHGANLGGEILKQTPLFVQGLKWYVTITDEYLVIGCRRHTHAQWAEFSDEEITKMEPRAAEFWATWKQLLLAMCAAHAANGEKT